VWKGTTESVDLGLAESLTLSLPRGRYKDLKPAMDVPRQLVAPIKKGQAIGKLRVSLDGKVIAERPLVALQAVEEAGFFGRLWDELGMWWESD
jgi:serine-type D-Ala-D-Ala carboxypeptidase (penicillin-binding protein 5/6)